MQEKTVAHLSYMADWNPDPRVLAKIQHLSISEYWRIKYFKSRQCLLSDLCSNFYDDANDCFIIGENRLTITLEDVHYLSGLPIDGKPLVIADPANIIDECVKLLGRVNPDDKKGWISFKWLKTTYSVVPPGIEEDDRVFLYYVRAYVLYVIGAVIFPSSSRRSSVSANYLLFLEDIEKFNDYAWGAGMLAQLLSSIKYAKMKGLKTMHGADWLLQLFIMERLPSVAKTLLRVDGEYQVPTEVPYIVEWSAFLRVPSQYSFKGYDFHQKLVDAGQQIKWRPYVERNGVHAESED
ncbi:protein MAIN-LIKE 2-like [Mercurialis annua]|uniref:protein MAIN-LIKE 2-like n=1 Tax=Mercurialis annua TaxID=3986 RepID=UPI0024AEAF34|nr:protein MAIN-LIKE 2-like [Mercurialis annua]